MWLLSTTITGDPATYYKKTFDVPEDAKYRALTGTCAAVVDMKVEPFVLGQVPSTPKNPPSVEAPVAASAAPVAAPAASPSSAAVAMAGQGAVPVIPTLVLLVLAAFMVHA